MLGLNLSDCIPQFKIDRVVESAQSFQDIQEKDDGLWWEYKTPNVNGNEVVLRIDADPDAVNAALV
ncbi:MAG: hypothetical protein QNJ70_19215 [Xenococcaceae cyanobacterium MO_207.B15]|nr:hypothetical protein [Xenococcaceae cyanobacterium MO_207.B15]